MHKEGFTISTVPFSCKHVDLKPLSVSVRDRKLT